jgi:predicted lipid-binding transport protein (Tim44 family)
MNDSSIIEYVILGGITLFIIRQLYNVLGSSPDSYQEKTIDKNRKDETKKACATIINLSETLAASFADEKKKKDEDCDSITACIAELDEDFNVDDFKTGAEKAFKIILNAYAEEDEQKLQKLLDENVFEQFSSAIAERQKTNKNMEIDIIGVLSCNIIDAYISNGKASIVVEFISEQINYTKDTDTDELVDGDPARINTIHDVWTFTRVLGTDNPNWSLVATSSPNEN